jgi:hypothetical protein
MDWAAFWLSSKTIARPGKEIIAPFPQNAQRIVAKIAKQPEGAILAIPAVFDGFTGLKGHAVLCGKNSSGHPSRKVPQPQSDLYAPNQVMLRRHIAAHGWKKDLRNTIALQSVLEFLCRQTRWCKHESMLP